MCGKPSFALTLTLSLLSFGAGVLAGTLFAPAAGERTRRRLRRRGEELADRATATTEAAVKAIERAGARLA
jgi:hypothetical protein